MNVLFWKLKSESTTFSIPLPLTPPLPTRLKLKIISKFHSLKVHGFFECPNVWDGQVCREKREANEGQNSSKINTK